MTSFIDALSSTYSKILKACLQDEALQTLKALESEEYISQRVSQLFSQVFNEQRQQLIQQLTIKNKQLISECNQLKKTTTINIKESTDCNITDGTKKLNLSIMAQNQQLKIQLSKTRQKHMIHTEQLQYNLQKLNEELISSRNFYEKEISKINKIMQKKTQDMKKYIEEKHQLIEENQKLKDQISTMVHKDSALQMMIKDSNYKIETQKNHNKSLKSSNEVLEEKLIRMQQQNKHLEQLIQKYQQQSKILKQRTQREENRYVSEPKVQNNYESNVQLITKLNSREKLLIQLKKQKDQFRESSQQISKQFHEYQYNSEMKIKQLQVQLKDNQTKFDRQVRIIRQQSNKQNQKRRQHFQQQLQQKTNNIITQYQQKLLKTNEEITHLTRKLNEINRQYLKNTQSNQQNQEKYKTQLENIKKLYEQELIKNKQLSRNITVQKSYHESIVQQLNNKVKDGEMENEELIKINVQIQARNTKNQIELERFQKIHKCQTASNDHNKKELQYLHHQLKEVTQQKSELSQQHRHQTKQLTNIKQKLQQNAQHLECQRQKNQKMLLKIQHLTSSLQTVELQLKKQKQSKVQLQINNEIEINKLKDKHTQQINTIQKQVQKHYENLIKNKEFKSQRNYEQTNKFKNSVIELERQIDQLKQLNETRKGQLLQTQKSLEMEQKNNQQNLNKIKQLQQTIKINSGNQTKQKQKFTYMNNFYDQQIQSYKRNFRSFKIQLYNGLKQIFDSLRADCQHVNNEVQEIKNLLMTETAQISLQLQKKCLYIDQTIEKKLKFYKDTFGAEKIQSAINLVKEAEQNYSKLLKEKTLEMMTVLADKQFQIKSLSEKQSNLKKKCNEHSEKQTQLEKHERELKLQCQQLKQTKQKLQTKLRQSQKQFSNLKHCYEQKQTQNQHLQQTIVYSQKIFKQKLQQCRQKYIHENEKLFDRYEKQFTKLITFNNRGKQTYGLSTSSSFSNLHDNYMKPTGSKDLSKITKIKQEIDQQKKKIKTMNKL